MVRQIVAASALNAPKTGADYLYYNPQFEEPHNETVPLRLVTDAGKRIDPLRDYIPIKEPLLRYNDPLKSLYDKLATQMHLRSDISQCFGTCVDTLKSIRSGHRRARENGGPEADVIDQDMTDTLRMQAGFTAMRQTIRESLDG